MSSDDLKESLETFAAVLNHVIAESVGKDLARQRGYRNARTLALQNITEVLEIRVPATHDRVFQFEGGDIGSAHDLVRRVHVSRGAMGLGIADLYCAC